MARLAAELQWHLAIVPEPSRYQNAGADSDDDDELPPLVDLDLTED